MAGRRRRGLAVQFLPPPSPRIERDCHPYPKHELEAARGELIRLLQWRSMKMDPIKEKIGILPDNRRFIYTGQKILQAGEVHESPGPSRDGGFFIGSQDGNPGFDPFEVSGVTTSGFPTGNNRKQKLTEEQNTGNGEPHPKKMKGDLATKPSGKPTSDETKSVKPKKLGVFFKCDLCGFADTTSAVVTSHLEKAGHCSASEFQGVVDPHFLAHRLLKPMTLTSGSSDICSLVPVCRMCGNRFDNVFSCLGHMVVSHKSQSFTYHVRQVKEALMVEIENVGAKPTCSVCQSKHNCLEDLFNHCDVACHFLHELRKNSSDLYFVCKMESCQKFFPNGQQMMNHLKMHESDVPKYSFVWAQLGEFLELTLLDEALDSESRIDFESVLCSHLAVFFERSTCRDRDCKQKLKNLDKYWELLRERRRDLDKQKQKT